MHTVTGRWKLGLALALTAAMLWGTLPVATKVVLPSMDAYTVTWYRFTTAALLLSVILACTRGLPRIRGVSRPVWGLLAVAMIGLVSNYVLYLMSLHYVSPAVAQVVMQVGPMFFLLGGLVFYRETLTWVQRAGFVLLIAGLTLFFNRRLPELLDLTRGSGLGVVLIVVSALGWAVYGLTQKRLTTRFKPQQILLLIYAGAIVVLAPMTKPLSVTGLTALQGWMLAFACANTLVAYGAFVEALAHWEVSRVGAVLATAPLFTLAAMWAMNHFLPGALQPDQFNALTLSGALLTIAGSAICALGGDIEKLMGRHGARR